MKYSHEQLLKIEDRAKKTKNKLTHVTDKTKLSTEDKFKLGLCKQFVQFSVTKKVKFNRIAKMIGIPLSRISEIMNYKINKFSVDILLKHLSVLAQHDANVREYLILLNQAVEMPALPVLPMKRLTQNLKEAASHI